MWCASLNVKGLGQSCVTRLHPRRGVAEYHKRPALGRLFCKSHARKLVRSGVPTIFAITRNMVGYARPYGQTNSKWGLVTREMQEIAFEITQSLVASSFKYACSQIAMQNRQISSRVNCCQQAQVSKIDKFMWHFINYAFSALVANASMHEFLEKVYRSATRTRCMGSVYKVLYSIIF